MVSYQTDDRNSMNKLINTDGSDSGCGYDYDYDYEEVETLSLCDLPIYSSSGGGASFESKKGDHGSSDDQEDDFFEFFSGGLDSTTWDNDNVIFCGKLIPYKIPQVHQIVNKNEQLPIKKQPQCFFQWKFGKNTTESRILNDTTPKSCQANNDKKSKCGVSRANNKLAGELILASPAKSKLHMFLFGLTKIPTEMELSDMRNRQHRRTPSSSVKYQSFDETKKGKEVTRNASKKKTSSTTSGKGLWKLLKVLSCKKKVSAGGI